MSKNISEMTDPELNDAVAIEVMGWMKSEFGMMAGQYQYPVKDGSPKIIYSWDPTHDLNQSYDAERKLCDDIPYEEYLTALDIVVWHPFGKVHASARQRCEAMLMAVRNG